MLKLNLKKPILPQLRKEFRTGACLKCGSKFGGDKWYMCAACRQKLDIKGSTDMDNYLLIHAICSATIGGRKRRKRLK